MEHPVKEIEGVITSLTKGSPPEQEEALYSYFLSNASFSHPFCYVPPLAKGSVPFAPAIDSAWLILGIYRWYRTLSPNIDITIDSAVFDQRSGNLYVSMRQTFAVWFIPFYKAQVKLVSVLHLTQRTSWAPEETVTRRALAESREPAALAGPGRERARYYISSQEDLYTINDCIRFLVPGVGPLLWCLWQLYSTLLCVVGSLVFMPLYLVLNKNKVKAR
ncbi:unnamed protein product [Clonostachys rosea]|uniref:SigF-like NTF2-like domain-containing protein n=1 Tax=Bionectria ochroleuca TaxID=29856 RepID=A0ABY6TTK2_BIOOC|nr:unnamed protein product [Clonostachys rosea]